MAAETVRKQRRCQTGSVVWTSAGVVDCLGHHIAQCDFVQLVSILSAKSSAFEEAGVMAGKNGRLTTKVI